MAKSIESLIPLFKDKAPAFYAVVEAMPEGRYSVLEYWNEFQAKSTEKLNPFLQMLFTKAVLNKPEINTVQIDRAEMLTLLKEQL